MKIATIAVSVAFISLGAAGSLAGEAYISQAAIQPAVAGSAMDRVSSLLATPVKLPAPQAPSLPPGAANAAQVIQIGSFNSGTVTQTGVGNVAALVQQGSGNVAVISQSNRGR